MKLIIEMPEWYYEETKEFKHPTLIDKAIINGTPLDDVKAEIRDLYVGYRHGYEIMADVLQILDNIGKEGEE